MCHLLVASPEVNVLGIDDVVGDLLCLRDAQTRFHASGERVRSVKQTQGRCHSERVAAVAVRTRGRYLGLTSPGGA